MQEESGPAGSLAFWISEYGDFHGTGLLQKEPSLKYLEMIAQFNRYLLYRSESSELLTKNIPNTFNVMTLQIIRHTSTLETVVSIHIFQTFLVFQIGI